MLGISTCDIISSTAYTLVGVMAPYEAGVYLSRGNMGSCKVQGFMIQLGQTMSMCYNVFLALYFLLVIVFGWREHRFKTARWWIHAIAAVSGVALAFGAIPFIEPQFGVCGILPPLTASQWQVSLFYTAPVSLVLLVLTGSTVAICRSVYMQEQRARKWKFGRRNSSIQSKARSVFWQSFWYVSAFYVTIPFMLVSFYVPFRYPEGFWIFVVTAILAPIQGLLNALVYLQRSKKLRWICGSVLRCTIRWESVRTGWRHSFRRPRSSATHDSDQPCERTSQLESCRNPRDAERVGQQGQFISAANLVEDSPAVTDAEHGAHAGEKASQEEEEITPTGNSANNQDNLPDVDAAVLEFWNLHQDED